MLSPLELNSPTIIYQSVAVLNNPFSLPEYKPKATKQENSPNTAFRLDSNVSDPTLPPTHRSSNADYLLTVHKRSNDQEMIASMGYSSSRSERHYKDNEDEKSLHHHTSCPSLPSNKVNRSKDREMCTTKSKTRKHYKRNGKQTRNNTKPRNLTLEPSDTEIYGGPKPYFVANTAHHADSPYLAQSEDSKDVYRVSTFVYNKHAAPMESNTRKEKKKNRKFLSIVPKKKYHHQIQRQKKEHHVPAVRSQSNPFNPFSNKYHIDDGDGNCNDDDDYSVYSEGVLYM